MGLGVKLEEVRGQEGGCLLPRRRLELWHGEEERRGQKTLVESETTITMG